MTSIPKEIMKLTVLCILFLSIGTTYGAPYGLVDIDQILSMANQAVAQANAAAIQATMQAHQTMQAIAEVKASGKYTCVPGTGMVVCKNHPISRIMWTENGLTCFSVDK